MILYVIGSLHRGGAERHLSLLLPELKKQELECQIYLLAGKGELVDELEKNGIKCTSLYGESGNARTNIVLRSIRLVITAIHFILFLYKHRPEIVHFFLPEAYVFGGYCALFFPSMKKIMSRRCLNNYQKRRPILRPLERLLHPAMDMIMGNSLAVLRQLEEEGCDKAKLRLAYNFVNSENHYESSHKSEERKKLGISDDALVLCVVANLIPYKGHQDLLQALVEVKDDLPENWRCLIIGRDDGVGEQLKNYAKDQGIIDNCLFLDSVPDTGKYLAISNIGLLVSHEEGFSNAIIEGMDAGLPMIVSDVGGNAEAVLDNVTGYVVSAGAVDEIANAILELSVKKNLRKEMGEAGKARVNEKFSIDNCVQVYREIYQSLVND